MRRFSLLFAFSLLALPARSHAEVLYYQAPILSSARFSDFGTQTGTGFRMYDDFVLANNASVERVTFWGVWLGPADASLPAPLPDVASWQFGFFTDAAGQPGAPVSSQTMAPASVSTTFLFPATFNFGGADNRQVNVYAITASLPSAVSLQGGASYWFSPFSTSATLLPGFAWLGTTFPSEPGNERSLQQQLGAGMSVLNTEIVGRDRGFQLEGTVPEPATLTLLGLAGAAALMRRRRTH